MEAMIIIPMLPTPLSGLAAHVAPIIHAASPANAFALADAAAAQLCGRAYTTILSLEAGTLSHRIFSTVPSVYPTGVTKELAASRWRAQVVDDGSIFVAADPVAIAANFPDPETVAGLGATCLVNIPIAGPDGRTIGLFNVGNALAYDTSQLSVLAVVGALLGQALLRAVHKPPSEAT